MWFAASCVFLVNCMHVQLMLRGFCVCVSAYCNFLLRGGHRSRGAGVCVCLVFQGEQVCVCVCARMRACMCVHAGEQVCLCGVLSRPDNGHIWTERERDKWETPTHMHTHTQDVQFMHINTTDTDEPLSLLLDLRIHSVHACESVWVSGWHTNWIKIVLGLQPVLMTKIMRVKHDGMSWKP